MTWEHPVPKRKELFKKKKKRKEKEKEKKEHQTDGDMSKGHKIQLEGSLYWTIWASK